MEAFLIFVMVIYLTFQGRETYVFGDFPTIRGKINYYTSSFGDSLSTGRNNPFKHAEAGILSKKKAIYWKRMVKRGSGVGPPVIKQEGQCMSAASRVSEAKILGPKY